MLTDLGLDLIKSFEGLRLKAYLDVKGVPTIGYGHTHGITQADVDKGRTCTESQADQWLREDIESAEDAILRHVDVALRQCEHEALVSLIFNIGAAAFATSTLRTKLNEGDKLGAACEFTRWNKVTLKGKKTPLDSQTARRTRELAHFLGAR
jgi:lysozyme